MSAADTPDFFTRQTLAAYLMVATRTIDRLYASKKLPPAIRVGASKRWSRGVIEEWLLLGCPTRKKMATLREGRK